MAPTSVKPTPMATHGGLRRYLGLVLVFNALVCGWSRDQCDPTTSSPRGRWDVVPMITPCSVEIPSLPTGGGHSGDEPIPTHALDCSFAVFAPVLEKPPRAVLRLSPTNNTNLCAELPAGYAKNSILVAHRGTCAMWKKVRVAERGGALALVVADSANRTSIPPRMRASKPPRGEANAMPNIPAVMVSSAAGYHLTNLANLTSGNRGGAATRVEAQIVTSHDFWHPVREEVKDWERVQRGISMTNDLVASYRGKPKAEITAMEKARAQGPLMGALSVLSWKLARSGWKDDSSRAAARADKLASKLTRAIQSDPIMRQQRAKLEEISEEDRRPLEQEKVSTLHRLVNLYPRVCEAGFVGGSTALHLMHAGASSYTVFGSPRANSRALTRFFDTEIAGNDPRIFKSFWGPYDTIIGDYIMGDPGALGSCDMIVIDGVGKHLATVLEFIRPLAAQDHVLIIDDTPCSQERCKFPNHIWSLNEYRGDLLTYQRSYFSRPEIGNRAAGFSVGKLSSRSELARVLQSKPQGQSMKDLSSEGITPQYFDQRSDEERAKNQDQDQGQGHGGVREEAGHHSDVDAESQ